MTRNLYYQTPNDHDACPPYEQLGFENNDDDDDDWADVDTVPDPTPANLTGVFVTPPLVLLPVILLLLTPNDALRNSTTGSRNN
uniref:Uncharacterized protein n=1 Tax=Trichogramma kaykai TaxID=54128 RepID=A0ABD2WD72_9HYME